MQYILTNLHSRFQRFIVRRISQNYDCFVTFGFCHQTIIRFFNSIGSNGQKTQSHTACCYTNRNAIHHLVESKVIFSITEFFGCENTAVNHLSYTLHYRSSIDISISNFLLNILLFIRQEIISIPCSVDIIFLPH